MSAVANIARAAVSLTSFVLWHGASSWAAAVGGDWPRWRGPDGNGVIAGEIDPRVLAPKAEIIWRTNVGEGCSSPSIQSGSLYTMGHAAGEDIVWGLDANTGRAVWRHCYPSRCHGTYRGAQCTPLVHEQRVYTISYEGLAMCLDAATGEELWRTDAKQYGAVVPTWGITTSPVLAGSNILYNVARHGLALRKHDGHLAWRSQNGGQNGYASPVLYDRAGTQAAVFFNNAGAFGVHANSGEVLWSLPWPPQEKPIAQYTADPLVWKDHVLVSAVYSRGTGLCHMGDGAPRCIWANQWAFKTSSPVLLDEHLYVPCGNKGEGTLACVEFLTGKTLWENDFHTGIAFVAVGRHLVVLTHRGDLRIAKATPAAYQEVAAVSLDSKLSGDARVGFTGVWWTPPVYCRGRLFCRKDNGELVCVRAD